MYSYYTDIFKEVTFFIKRYYLEFWPTGLNPWVVS